ncbi:hypothetical protein [Ensifer canadensis]
MEQARKPGTKLSEDTIADHFKVSRTSARGGLLRASREHIQIIRAQRSKDAAAAEKVMLEHLDAVELRTELNPDWAEPDISEILKRYASES